jgi:SET domain-containing protein
LVVEFKFDLPHLSSVYRLSRSREYPAKSSIDPRIEVRAASSEGKGMFALEPIREGETVVVWGGKLFTREDVKLGKAAKGSVSAVDGRLYLAGDVNEFPPDPSNFMNHSCDPNVWMKDEITLVARRDIEKGEELTGDYAMWEADEQYIASWACDCGSPTCRKRLTGKDWRLPELQERYGRHFSPFINRRIRRLKLSNSEEPARSND